MSKIRNVSADTRIADYGLPVSREVKPDDIIEVADAVAVFGYRFTDNWGNVTAERPEQTFADGYRNQPTIWAEVTGPAKALIPAPAADALKED